MLSLADKSLIYRATLESVLYGCYVVSFTIYREKQKKCPKPILVTLVPILFVLCTVFALSDIVRQYMIMVHPNGSMSGLEAIRSTLSVIIDILTKYALIYRCKMWWGRSPYLLIPIILATIHIGTSLVSSIASPKIHFPSWILAQGQVGSETGHSADIAIFVLLLFKSNAMARKRDAALYAIDKLYPGTQSYNLWIDTSLVINSVAYPFAMIGKVFEERCPYIPQSCVGLLMVGYGLATTLIFLGATEDEILFSRAERRRATISTSVDY